MFGLMDNAHYKLHLILIMINLTDIFNNFTVSRNAFKSNTNEIMLFFMSYTYCN